MFWDATRFVVASHLCSKGGQIDQEMAIFFF